jgi:DNA-binding NarL/FixJ family response regulator
VTVLVVDHPAPVRRALREGLARDPAVRVVGGAGRPPLALRLARALRPDVVLLDAEMPGLDLPGLVRALRLRSPGSALVVVGLEPDRLAGALQEDPRVRLVGKAAGPAALLAAVRRAGLSRPRPAAPAGEGRQGGEAAGVRAGSRHRAPSPENAPEPGGD